ncbi:3-oxoacyl-[acyl-carrier-protein] synthase III C-terminal domain-containing protein [Asticcacaulis solisilvae]|uniref:3-oxoacyl-[acyl-carrier-protein] synthase III C-terminal domain-containing protein n=1 Tax=Asticcacaulis solisilvae TaxID=1217274 RepID=UPI003FD79C4E
MTYPIAVAIRGCGHYRPALIQPSSALDAVYGQPDGWTETQFAISSRRIADRGETTSFMAARACEEALNEAGWAADEVDVLVGACGVMEQPIPGTSVLIQHELGLTKSGIPCFDVNMTCLSFLNALDLVSMAMKAGRFRRALIASSDIASAGLDYGHPKASAIFGDGAAAVCLEAHDDADGPAVLSTVFQTFSAGKDTAHLRSGGTRIRVEDGFDAIADGAKFHMDPFAIFKAAGRHLPGVIDRALAQAGIVRDQVDAFICHQASAPGLEYMRHLVGERPDRVVDIFADHGNQIAASLPNALYAARKDGMLGEGRHAMLLGTSAGISLGAMVIRT